MIALDLIVGIGRLLAALSLRRTPKPALLAAATGLLWFAGDVLGPLVFAHRAPVTHLLLLIPPASLPVAVAPLDCWRGVCRVPHLPDRATGSGDVGAFRGGPGRRGSRPTRKR